MEHHPPEHHTKQLTICFDQSLCLALFSLLVKFHTCADDGGGGSGGGGAM